MARPAGQFHPWRLIITFLVITGGLFALVLFTPGSTAPKLGIDLQGGTRVTLQAETITGDSPSSDSMKQARTIMEERVNGSGVAGAQVQIDGSNQLVVTVPGQNNLTGLTRSARLNIRPMVSRWVNPALLQQVTTGTDTPAPTSESTSTSPSTSAISTSPSTSATTTQGTGEGFRAANPALLPAATEPSVPTTTDAPEPQDSGQAKAEAAKGTSDEAPPLSAFPDDSDADVPTQPAGDDDAAYSAWEKAATTSAQSGPTCQQINYYQGLDDPDKPLLACDEQQQYIYLLAPTLIPGEQIKDATSGFGQNGEGWLINITFDKQGFDTWAAYTKKHWDTTDGNNPPPASFTAFTLDGEVLSAPVIRQPITTSGTQVSGSFTQQSAKALADSLKFGALPLAFERLTTTQVSAELGFQYLKAGLIAGGIGLALVVIYCLVYYRLLGLITILSLLLSGGLVYAVMVLLGRWINLSLDMAGIAGLIVAIGITADSFIVYFERIKDEVREGRTFRSAVPRGWTRAKKTILSADAVSFLSAAILYVLAVGGVKGFAFTLGLSTVLDLVVVFLVTHPLVALLSKANIFAHPIWSGLGSVAKAGREHRAATAQLQAKEA